MDDPFWMNYYPPNHFKCRSRVIALAEEDIQTYGYSVATERPKGEPQKGFTGNIGGSYLSGLKKQVNQKEKAVNDLYEKVTGYEV